VKQRNPSLFKSSSLKIFLPMVLEYGFLNASLSKVHNSSAVMKHDSDLLTARNILTKT